VNLELIIVVLRIWSDMVKKEFTEELGLGVGSEFVPITLDLVDL